LLTGAEDCAHELDTAAKFYEGAKDAAKNMRTLTYELSDVSAQVRELINSFDFSPERLTEINERLDFLYRISMKYGANESDILECLEKAVEERNFHLISSVFNLISELTDYLEDEEVLKEIDEYLSPQKVAI
jgi:DNA repair protein RecN (Recombination protein N)